MSGVVERCARAACIAVGDDPDREGGERVTGYDDMTRAVLTTLAAEITDEQMAALGDAIEFADDCEDGADWCALTDLHATLTELREAGR